MNSLRRRSTGFTLVELMIAASVASVLASVAYPSFSGALHKARRSEAQIALILLQQAQERWRSDNSRYASLADLGLAAETVSHNYALSVTEPSADGYVAVAQAANAQLGDRTCRYMLLSVALGNLSYRSGETPAAANDAQANRQCWGQ